jgi:hypothetical protein
VITSNPPCYKSDRLTNVRTKLWDTPLDDYEVFLMQQREIATSPLRVQLTVSRIILSDEISDNIAPSWHITSWPRAPSIPEAAPYVGIFRSATKWRRCRSKARQTWQHCQYTLEWRAPDEYKLRRTRLKGWERNCKFIVTETATDKRLINTRRSPLCCQTSPSSYPVKKAPVTHWIGGQLGPRDGLDAVLERNMSAA